MNGSLGTRRRGTYPSGSHSGAVGESPPTFMADDRRAAVEILAANIRTEAALEVSIKTNCPL